jgi:hypothetical protein
MNTQLPQTNIQHLAQQINLLYKSCCEERIQLVDWEDDRPFSILGELELLVSAVQAYVGRSADIRSAAGHRLDAAAIADLQQRNPLLIPAIGDWYFTQGHEYPGLCRYLELLDYLRLSLLSAADRARFQAA